MAGVNFKRRLGFHYKFFTRLKKILSRHKNVTLFDTCCIGIFVSRHIAVRFCSTVLIKCMLTGADLKHGLMGD